MPIAIGDTCPQRGHGALQVKSKLERVLRGLNRAPVDEHERLLRAMRSDDDEAATLVLVALKDAIL